MMLAHFGSLMNKISHKWSIKRIVSHRTCYSLLLYFDISISQGSVAIQLRCGGVFYYCFTTNLLQCLLVK